MASCCDTSPEWVVYRGEDISASISGTDLATIDFFLLFYVERRNYIKIEKADMIQADLTTYNFIISSLVSKGMDLGQHMVELWRVPELKRMKKAQAFFMKDSQGKKEV